MKIVPIVLCVISSEATAQQGGWLIETTSIVSPSNPTTTVEVWAWFDDPTGERNVFASGVFDLFAGDGAFSNIQLPIGYTPGTIVGSSVRGAFVGQFFGGLGIFGNADNPILVWTANWTTTNFTTRMVSLVTLNTEFFKIGTNTGFGNPNLLDLYPQGFTPGAGVIEVVPSPASAMPLIVAGALMLRRCRPK